MRAQCKDSPKVDKWLGIDFASTVTTLRGPPYNWPIPYEYLVSVRAAYEQIRYLVTILPLCTAMAAIRG